MGSSFVSRIWSNSSIVTFLLGKKSRISNPPRPTLPFAPVIPKIKGHNSFVSYYYFIDYPIFFKSLKAS